jgi:ribosome-binding factor A
MRPIQKKTNRVEKVNSLLEHLMGTVLLPYIKTVDGLVSIRKVETSKDLRWAKVWLTIVNGNDESIMGMLKNNLYDIQGEVNRLMEVKIVPRISFHLDTTARYADHISKIFKEIEHEREEGGAADIGAGDGENKNAENIDGE